MVIVAAIAVSGFIMSAWSVASAGKAEVSYCWLERERLITQAAATLSSHDATHLASVFSSDVIFDVSAAGGPGPLVGLSDLAMFFDVVQMVVRTQSVILSNTQANKCPGTVTTRYHSIQAMDQILSPNDTTLPAIIGGGSAIIEFSPSNTRISSFLLQGNLTQLFVSEKVSGVVLPLVKRKRGVDHDALMWGMLVNWITEARSNGHFQMAALLENTPVYTALFTMYGS